jgi:argininosuccinate lyase
MQEDKEPVFDALKTIKISLLATKGMIADFCVQKDQMKKSSIYGHSTATDLADYLVQNFAIPFRMAHHITGKIVKLANEKNCNIWELSLEEMQKIEPQINNNVFDLIGLESSVNRKQSYGGTAKSQVENQIKRVENILVNIQIK